MASSSRAIKPEGLSPTSKVEDTNGKYPGSKRLGLGVRRCLFGASYDRSRTCPRWAA